eukprot:15040683-Alexandrium_andersonii.AAC.1
MFAVARPTAADKARSTAQQQASLNPPWPAAQASTLRRSPRSAPNARASECGTAPQAVHRGSEQLRAVFR